MRRILITDAGLVTSKRDQKRYFLLPYQVSYDRGGEGTVVLQRRMTECVMK